MLAVLGFATVGLLLTAIMSGRMSPLVALIAVPTIAAVVAGMGGQIGPFVLSGLQQTAPVAAMFVFAILYFGVMTDAGLLDPIVNRILRGIGCRPRRVVMGAALLALLVHLDGSGAVTFLVTIPAMLPLFVRSVRPSRPVTSSPKRNVTPRSRFNCRISPINCVALRESRLAVASSASTMAGR